MLFFACWYGTYLHKETLYYTTNNNNENTTGLEHFVLFMRDRHAKTNQ